MNDQELQEIFEKHAANQAFRILVAVIVEKLCSFSITAEISSPEKVTLPAIDGELTRVQEILQIQGIDPAILTRALTKFFFANVIKARNN
jgi:hypothetical protein